MDSELTLIDGRRLARLRREDIATIAHAIVAAVRKRAQAGVCCVQNVEFVKIEGAAVSVAILKPDWARIAPLVEAELFNPSLFPPSPTGGYSNPQVAYDEALVDHADRAFYNRVVAKLQVLVTETFPTRPY